ncbi:hypothetical protein HW130_03230 [Streptomyces sp. PKU-EA00015]|uniref:hypothetical protein n=1 Tax=Streptomyces sp. PKU-EA00015 TaxID=2748326 RepID=UPI0015A24CF6|nr:hypothetical protein [Streptomyces sp. PKU-EA00015]NWF25285.1 hypothetical protein [Streptomyces sp. PKU-EA00015]
MTYTLAMASDQGIQIAEDGVAEVSMTKARASLTELIRGVRWGGKPAAFTERGQRVAMVVAPEFYETALTDRRMVDALRKTLEGMSKEQLDSNPLLVDFAKRYVGFDV